MIQVSNSEFLNAIFGEDAPWTHVTDFIHDPGNIPKDQHLFAWKGDYFSRYRMDQNTNQYFTISHFYCDEQQQARRRKALYRHTRVIVLDDVREKLNMNEVSKLPRPAWILESSAGSEQWGYILNKPCVERGRVENLLDGLVANGLAPDGKDPGMKGVTRYVRLPEGINNKAAKLVDGQPFKCRILQWEPFNRVTLEQLAEPFSVNLDAARRDSRVDGAADVPDHPLLNISDIHVKEVRSDGRFDITCPWVDEHTGADDNGAAIFTNDDGTMGFKCHHGSCQSRTGRDLLRYIDTRHPGFTENYASWQIMREFSKVAEPSFLDATVTQPTVTVAQPEVSFLNTTTTEPVVENVEMSLDAVFLEFQREVPGSKEQRVKAGMLLKAVESLPVMDKKEWHDRVRDTMRWSKPDFNSILKDLQKEWYASDGVVNSEFDYIFFVKELNQFYDWKKRIFFSVEAFQNSYCHDDPDAKKTALMQSMTTKVDRLDYAPKMPRTFEEDGRFYGNTWYEGDQSKGIPGDISRWLDHWDAMGWGAYRDHAMKWMAYTILMPENKINHMMIFGGYEGSGKDFLIYPLMKAMGHHYKVISGDELISDFNDYAMNVKFLHVNEAELGGRREAMTVGNKLKPYTAAPPEHLRINQKGIRAVDVRNIVNCIMTTNSQTPVTLDGDTRRMYAMWSDLCVRDEHGDMLPEWQNYWDDRWTWMKDDNNWQAVVYYLRNCVDISNFSPGNAPPVTEFLRDIRESSKSPAQQTIEAFINARVKAFSCDLLTTSDIVEVMRGAEMSPETSKLLYVSDVKRFTPNLIGRVLGNIPTCRQVQAHRRGTSARVWILRNSAKYKDMGKADIYTEYERQVQSLKTGMHLEVVK